MAGNGTGTAGASSAPAWVSVSPHSHTASIRYENPICTSFCNRKLPSSTVFCRSQASFFSSRSPVVEKNARRSANLLSTKASSAATVGSSEYIEEPGTNVKFQKTLSLPGCSNPLILLGIGFREKVFAILGVKVYAAGLYINSSMLSKLSASSGQSSADIQNVSSLFRSIYEDPLEKSLQIVLVRDVDGKTFWDALSDAISPRIKTQTPADKLALAEFRSTFEGRPLKKGTLIFLTWLEPPKMLVSISADGLPSAVDATIESSNVTTALFDVFLGDGPVSPTLKASVSNGLTNLFK